MSLNKNNITFFLLLYIGGGILIAQHQKENLIAIDTTKFEALEEVIVTGQYNPQSLSKSVFEVTVITATDIEQRAATNLADLLNQTLNINITPDVSTGKSSVSLFGLDAQYFKILIDNIPVVNEEGFGNNVDLTLINLDDVKQIEIVEGAMGVQYGANAVSGVINIITKKSYHEKTQIRLYVQEETVGDEYNFVGKGRHIQSIKVGNNFTDNLYGNISYLRNDFGGFWNNKQGKNYDKDDGLRGHEWLPKELHNAKILLNYKGDNFSVFYKYDFLIEEIDQYNEDVILNINSATNTDNPTALDVIATNTRNIHHLNTVGNLQDKVNYNISMSYQKQSKEFESYKYTIRSEEKSDIEKYEYSSTQALFSRGTFSNFLSTDNFNCQVGYEIGNEKGYRSPSSIDANYENVTQKLNNYDIFMSSEININDHLYIRPGARVSFVNLFENQYHFSLTSKYNFNHNIELRARISSANRTPNFDELYTNDALPSHNFLFLGNINLKPERGYSGGIHLKKTSYIINDIAILNNKLSIAFTDIEDRIESILLPDSDPITYQYSNIDSYKNYRISSENSFQYQNFKFNLGLSFLGISKILDSSANSKDDYLNSFQFNSNIIYSIPKYNMSCSIFFKSVGEEPQFVQKTNEDNEEEYQIETTDGYQLLDATVKKIFKNKVIETTFGIRNIFDISTVNTTSTSGGAHTDAPTSVPRAYGRSYFLKITYNLNL